MTRSEDIDGGAPLPGASDGTRRVNAALSARALAEAESEAGDDDMPAPHHFPALTELDPTTALRDRRALMLLSIRDAGIRAPLSQEIFDELAISIVEGRLHRGDDTTWVHLARRFKTSRTPVREALAELERHGVVVIPPRRRPYIAGATLKQIRDVYEVRANLFTLVSETIVDRCPKSRLS